MSGSFLSGAITPQPKAGGVAQQRCCKSMTPTAGKHRLSPPLNWTLIRFRTTKLSTVSIFNIPRYFIRAHSRPTAVGNHTLALRASIQPLSLAADAAQRVSGWLWPEPAVSECLCVQMARAQLLRTHAFWLHNLTLWSSLSPALFLWLDNTGGVQLKWQAHFSQKV